MSSPTDPTTTEALAEPVDLPLERKREILAREAVLGQDHWAVLGLERGAPYEAVRSAYLAASRLFHPDRYYGKSLGSFQGRLERIFRRVTEAHEALIADLRPRGATPAPGSAQGTPTPRAATAFGRQGTPLPREGTPLPRNGTPLPRRGTPVPAPPDPEQVRADERRARLARHPYLARGAQAKALVAEAQRHLAAAAPDKALGLLARAQALGAGRGTAGATDLESVARRERDRQRAEEEMQRGKLAAGAGDTGAASAAFARAASLDPSRADASYEAARWMLRANGKLAEARAHAQRAVELRDDHLPSLLVLAEICARMGMGSVARRHVDAVLAKDPKNAEARALLRQLR